MSVTTKLQHGGQKEGEAIKIYLGFKVNHINVFFYFSASSLVGKNMGQIGSILQLNVFISHTYLATHIYTYMRPHTWSHL